MIRTFLQRAFRFYAVGAVGAALQLVILAVLVHVAGVHYGVATAVALSATLVHNFIWHARWTWRDRRPRGGAPAAFVRFVAGNGGVSIAGTAILMPVFVEQIGLPAVAANAATIVSCGLLNFWLASTVFSSIVSELKLDPEVAGPQKPDGVLQLVLRRR